MNFKSVKKNFFSVLILFIFGFILFSSALFFSFQYGQNLSYDFLVRLTAEKKISDDILVVSIDDQSINKIGRWPWSRTYYTDIFEYLENYAGANVIAFDSILVSYGNKKDDREFFERFSKLNKVIPGVFFSKKQNYFNNQNDIELKELFKNKFQINLTDHRTDKIKIQSEYKSSSYALEEILQAAPNIGSVLSYADNDGYIRKFEPVFLFNDSYYPSLALSVFLKVYPDTKFNIKDSLLYTDNLSGDEPLKIPLNSRENGSFAFINWHLPEKNHGSPYKTYSAWQVIRSYEQIKNGESPLINPEVFKDKIVVVGTTSTALRDIKTTPVKHDYPGVYIQANLIENVLNNEFIYKPSVFLNKLFLIATLLISFAIIFFLPPLYSSVSLTFFAVGYFYLCLFWAYPNRIALDALTPVLFIICSMLLGYGYKYFIEDSKKKKVRNLIAKYVSRDIMEQILKDVDSAKLGGKRAEISVLFIDIRNFTTISETLDPENVSEILNEYFAEMIPIIFKYKGTVNKFIGDALLVIFGAPLDQKNHAELAVRCSLEMLNRVNKLKEKFIKEDKPEINVGIGISTGEAFVGNIGSDERFEYSAVGNTVNIANRLENFNKLYKTSILISESTFEVVKDIIEAEEVDSVCVTQNSEPVKIYELKAISNNIAQKNDSANPN